MLVGHCGYLNVVDTFSRAVKRSRGNGVEVGSVVVGRAGERTSKEIFMYIFILALFISIVKVNVFY